MSGKPSESSSTSNNTPNTTSGTNIGNSDYEDLLRNRMNSSQYSNTPISELDRYMKEMCELLNPKFDLLLWWKINSTWFPILSMNARDVFAIPISVVASESVFSTGGKVLDAYRSSLKEKTLECLVCAQDWLRISFDPKKDEDVEIIEQIEKDLVEKEVARFG